jgi:hypothetical protein
MHHCSVCNEPAFFGYELGSPNEYWRCERHQELNDPIADAMRIMQQRGPRERSVWSVALPPQLRTSPRKVRSRLGAKIMPTRRQRPNSNAFAGHGNPRPCSRTTRVFLLFRELLRIIDCIASTTPGFSHESCKVPAQHDSYAALSMLLPRSGGAGSRDAGLRGRKRRGSYRYSEDARLGTQGRQLRALGGDPVPPRRKMPRCVCSLIPQKTAPHSRLNWLWGEHRKANSRLLVALISASASLSRAS